MKTKQLACGPPTREHVPSQFSSKKICPRFDARYSTFGIGFLLIEVPFRAKGLLGKPLAD
jgi:hypothetical protein